MSYLAAAGSLLSAVGSITGGIAGANNSNYQAAVAANNAAIANNNATYTMEAGQVSAANQGRKGAADSGKLKVSQAASGVSVNTGSAVNVQVGERETNQLDTETVLNNSELKAYGYRTEAVNDTAQSKLDTTEASQDEIAGGLAAGGGLLSSASSIGTKWTGATGGVTVPGFNPIAGVSGQ